MELIKPGTNIDFVGSMKWALLVSLSLILLSIATLVARGGPNYGVDFVGGTMLQVRFKQRTSISAVREAIAPLGLGDVTIQDFGTSSDQSEFLIRLPVSSEDINFADQLSKTLEAKFGSGTFEIVRQEMVGPRVGRNLRAQALMAVVFATLMMATYIWFRFEWRFGVGAAVALAHDVIIAIGALALFHYEFDLTIVAALLTVVGFSVHDTVIVSDRIRENMRKNRRDPFAKIINTSINETLSRTILTSGTAIMMLLALFLLGGNVINGFAFALLIGITFGTASSIFIASPIVLLLERGTRR